MSIGDGASGETVLLRLSGELTRHPVSVVTPLLLPDSPVVAWWPTNAPDDPAHDPLGRLAQRRITDCAAMARGRRTALQNQAEHYAPGNTDLAWTRLTPWRALLAAGLDQHPVRITAATVEAETPNASAELLGAWLGHRLEVPVERAGSKGPGITAVRLHSSHGDIALDRPDGRLARFAIPGQADRPVALQRRNTAELLAEELRRLDNDDVYQETLLAYGRQAAPPGRTRKKAATARKQAAARQAAKQTPKKRAAKKQTVGERAAKKTARSRQEDRPQERAERLVSGDRTVVVHHDAEVVAAATPPGCSPGWWTCRRTGRVPSVVLTGGGIARVGAPAVRRLAGPGRRRLAPPRPVVGRRAVRAGGRPGAQRGHARADLLDAVPVDPARVHPMAASDGPYGDDADAAAEAYAEQLARGASPEDHGEVPTFDVLMLGRGAGRARGLAVPRAPGLLRRARRRRGAQLPEAAAEPAVVTFGTLNHAREVWFLVAGEEKARAVRLALSGAGQLQVPAAGPRGLERTLWMLDAAAASQLPSDFARPASP